MNYLRPSKSLFSWLISAGLALSAASSADAQFTISWDTLGFSQNDPSLDGTNTNIGSLTDVYHGLAGSSGGVSGFQSQNFTNVGGSGVDLTLYYSNNNYDGSVLEGPDLYEVSGGSSTNPDARVTGDTALRVTRDLTADSPGSQRAPVTIVYSFSAPVLVDEFIQGSLSVVGSSHENSFVRAFASNDATGAVTKASYFENISDLSDGSSLVHNDWDPTAPTTNNALSNIAVDTDLTLDAGGVATNVGSAADDGLYHIIGLGDQGESRYGRAAMAWQDSAVQSIAVSYWASPSADFSDYDTTSQWVSTISAPTTITPVPEPGSALFALVGFGFFACRRRR